MAKRKYSVEFGDLAEANLTVAAHEAKVEKHVIVQRALTLYLLAQREIKAGGKILIEDKDGDTKEIKIW